MEEIKASDIMIGNWFSHTNENGTFNLQVEEIRPTGIIVTWNGGSWFVSYDKLKPIPLTEDILLKCGGTKKEHITLELTKGRKLLFTTRHTKYHQVFLLHDDDMIALSMDKIYLHQLQNLFKSLTGNDLKIEV